MTDWTAIQLAMARAPIFEPWDEATKPAKSRKPPKPLTLARALRDAKKAGVTVAGATVENGKVTLQFGEPQTNQKTNNNDLDKWLAEHHAH